MVAVISDWHPWKIPLMSVALGMLPIVAVARAKHPEKADETLCADARSGSETVVRAEQSLAREDTLAAFSMPRTSGSFVKYGFRAKQ